MAGDASITVEEQWFEIGEGKQLLQSIRSEDLPGTKDLLQKVLDRMKEELCEKDGNEKNRKLWRDHRIKLYDNLLLIALGAEGKERKLWTQTTDIDRPCDSKSCLCHSQSCPKKVTRGDKVSKEEWIPDVTAKAKSKFVSGSIYTYLLDHIHEDEEIMFKYYHAQSRSRYPLGLREKALWLVESIKVYRIRLVSPVVQALKRWEEEMIKGEKYRRTLLDKAKAAFKKNVLSHGRSLSDRSWRNRARLYWLLALAKHAPIANGQVGRFKNLRYKGPIATLVLELINEDEEMLLEKANDLLFQYTRVIYDKREKDLQLGTLKICSLLAWASAANDQDLVERILLHKNDYMKGIDGDWEWEESWKESWAHALWNAAFMGHAQIAKALLKCDFPYHELYFKYYSRKKLQPPLHVAVRRGHIAVVEAFCTESSKNFSCHDENVDDQTPLEVSTTLKECKVVKKKIQSILLQRDEVKQAVEELSLQRELTVGSANAIMVGATLIAGITYGGWLSPPLGFNSYYQFTEPLPAPPDSYESYMSIEGHTTIQIFAIFNAMSFFCAIAAVVAGMETTCFIEALEETYMAKTVEKLRYKLKRTTILFIASVIFVLIAFASAGIAILPPIKHHQRNMYITIAVGGFMCVMFICRMLLFCVSKHLYKWTNRKFGHMSKWTNRKFGHMCKWMVEKFCPNLFRGGFRDCISLRKTKNSPKYVVSAKYNSETTQQRRLESTVTGG